MAASSSIRSWCLQRGSNRTLLTRLQAFRLYRVKNSKKVLIAIWAMLCAMYRASPSLVRLPNAIFSSVAYPVAIRSFWLTESVRAHVMPAPMAIPVLNRASCRQPMRLSASKLFAVRCHRFMVPMQWAASSTSSPRKFQTSGAAR